MTLATIVTLALAVGVAPAEGPDAPGLVGRLTSARPAERAEAALALEELGAEALPALREALDADDEPTRAAARALIARIEGALLAEPTLVTLDPDGLPLAEVVASLSDRSGVPILLDPADGLDPGGRPIALATPEPMPFWEALRLLGRSGHVRHHPGHRGYFEDERPTIRLVDGDPPPWTLVRGPFRIHLARISYESEAGEPRRGAGGSPPRRTLTAEIQVFAEPRMFLDPDGLPEVEAIDEEGRPLPPPPIESGRPIPEPQSWAHPGSLPMSEYEVSFGVPDPRPGRLRALRGTIPVVVSARHGDPLEVALDAPGDEPPHDGDSPIRIERYTPGGRDVRLTVAIAPPDPARGAPPANLPGRPTASRIGPTGLIRNRIEAVDDSGRPLPIIVGRAGLAEDGAERFSIIVGRPDPARLRFHDLLATAAEVEFEFRDVPLP